MCVLFLNGRMTPDSAVSHELFQNMLPFRVSLIRCESLFIKIYPYDEGDEGQISDATQLFFFSTTPLSMDIPISCCGLIF